MRRIQYKILLKNPPEAEYREIFGKVCKSRGVEFAPAVLDICIAKRYKTTGRPMRRCQPRDVISHAMDIINFERRPLELTDEVLDRAWDSCFAENPDMEG